MTTLWDQYNLIYYCAQCSLFVIIYVFLVICIPYDLMNWIIKALFFLDPLEDEPDESVGKKSHRHPDCDTCINIRSYFERGLECACCPCCGRTNDEHNCLTKFYYCCSECRCGDGDEKDLEDAKLPHEVRLKLRRKSGRWYCGCIHLNMNRIGIYLLLCGCVWCASIAFFQAVILSYANVSKTYIFCPLPKFGSPTTVMHCFIYANAFDASPMNETFPVPCNATFPLSFTGFQASCFGWVLLGVEPIDVIEELGICAGIIAMLATFIIILFYLCRDHRWRLFFDIAACLTFATNFILLYERGYVPLIVYTLLGTIIGSIMITQYLQGYVPLCTWLCLAIRIYKRSKNCAKSNTQSKVKPFNSEDHQP